MLISLLSYEDGELDPSRYLLLRHHHVMSLQPECPFKDFIRILSFMPEGITTVVSHWGNKRSGHVSK